MSNTVNGFDFFLRLIRILVARKRTLILITAIPTLITVVAVMVSKSTYKAAALVKPPVSDNVSPIQAAIKESGASGFLGSFLGGGETGANDCLSLLRSVRFSRLVIQRFDLEAVYKFKKKNKKAKYYFANVIKRFQKNATFELNDEEEILISMIDESPERASDMVSYMIFLLDSLYTDVQRTATQHKLEYVDQRLNLAEADMKRMEDSTVAFQRQHNLIVPEAQVRLIMENAAQTEVQVETLKEEMSLEAAMRGTTGSRYRDLVTQKNLLEQALRKQLRSPKDSNALMLPANSIPALAMEFFRLERAYNIKLAVYKFLVQQVEALKLDANKNVQVISVLDPPWTSDKRVSPRRRVLVEAIFFLFFVLGAVFVVLQSVWEKHRQASPETGRLLADIRAELFRFSQSR